MFCWLSKQCREGVDNKKEQLPFQPEIQNYGYLILNNKIFPNIATYFEQNNTKNLKCNAMECTILKKFTSFQP